MGRIGKEKHEKRLLEVKTELEGNGWKFVDLRGTSPDAVACKDGKLVCIDVVGKCGSERNYKLVGGWTYKQKREWYARLGFDDVLVYDFPYH